MNAGAITDDTARMLEALVAREVARAGTVRRALPRLAGRLGVAPGTLENLRRGRLKSVCAGLRAGLWHHLSREIEREIAALTAELDRLNRQPLGSDPDTLAEVEAHLQEARALMETGR